MNGFNHAWLYGCLWRSTVKYLNNHELFMLPSGWTTATRSPDFWKYVAASDMEPDNTGVIHTEDTWKSTILSPSLFKKHHFFKTSLHQDVFANKWKTVGWHTLALSVVDLILASLDMVLMLWMGCQRIAAQHVINMLALSYKLRLTLASAAVPVQPHRAASVVCYSD